MDPPPSLSLFLLLLSRTVCSKHQNQVIVGRIAGKCVIRHVSKDTLKGASLHMNTPALTALVFYVASKLIIIIIIIAFKGAIRDLLQSPHSAANCLQHVRSSGPSAIVYKSRATHRALISCKCHVTCHLVRRDSSAIKFDRVEIAFI